MSGLFVGSNISSFYRCARPRYPSSALNSIISAWKQLLSPLNSNEISATELRNSGLAVDVACGSGQLTELLAGHFSKVIASDVSATQISAAKEAFVGSTNMEFLVGDCYDLKCPDGGADLITVAQALHWFDVPRFYAEVNRCLKPTGALAVMCYGFCSLRPEGKPNAERVNRLMSEYFLGEKYIGPYWDSRREFIEAKYTTLPVYNQEKCFRLSESMTLDLPMSQFVLYMKSMSAYHTYLETVKPKPENDALKLFIDELTSLVSEPAADEDGDGDAAPAAKEPVLPLVFPLTIIVSVK